MKVWMMRIKVKGGDRKDKVTANGQVCDMGIDHSE